MFVGKIRESFALLFFVEKKMRIFCIVIFCWEIVRIYCIAKDSHIFQQKITVYLKMKSAYA